MTFKSKKIYNPPLSETSEKVYGDSFNLDLAEHNSSTHTKSNFKSQFLDFREACGLHTKS